jgi:glycosyltransferase involved in cell wall biosynthesis
MKSTVRQRQLTVVGSVWDHWPILRLFDRVYESRFISIYKPWLKGMIPGERIELLGEQPRSALLLPFKILRRTFRVRKTIRSFKPDVVISHHDDANMSMLPVIMLTRLLQPRSRPRFVLWIRNSPSQHANSAYGSLALFCYRNLYRFADTIVVQTEANKKLVGDVAPVLKDKILVFPNVYATKEFRARGKEKLPEKFENSYDGFTYINIGRLTHQKAQWSLLRAFASIAKSRKNIRLVIIGDGPYKEKLEKLATELAVRNRVTFINHTDNVSMHFAHADCLVFPSLYEGFPNTLTEALIMDLPCISTDCPTGPRLIFLGDDAKTVKNYPVYTPGGVLLQNLDDEECWDTSALSPKERALADAMAAMHDNKKLRERSSNGSQLIKHYDFEDDRLADLARSLASRRKTN